MPRRLFVFPLLCSLLGGPVAPVRALTLHDALALVASHPGLLPLEIARERAAAQALDAGRRGPDTVALEVENFGGDLNGLTEAEATLAVTRPLLDRCRVRAARSLATLEIDRARLEHTRLQWELSSEVQRTFHALLAAIALAEVASEAVELAAGLREATLGRVEAGRSPPSENLGAEITLERARAESKRLQGRIRQLLRALERATGARALKITDIEGNLTTAITLPDRASLEGSLLRTHPEMRRLALARQETAGRLSQARAAIRPEYSVSGGIRNLRAADDRDRVTFVVGLEAALPSPRSNRGERRALSRQQDQIDAEDAQVRHHLLTTLAEAIERFITSREVAIDLQERVLPAAARLHDLAMEGYRLGKTSQLAVFDARQALLESRRDFFQTLDELYQAIDTIEQLCGVCLVGESH